MAAHPPPVPKPRKIHIYPSSSPSSTRKQDDSRAAVSGQESIDGSSSMEEINSRQATPPPSKPKENGNTSDPETLSSGKEGEGEKVVVTRPRRRLPSVESGEESGPDYENIDEHLEREEQKQFRRSDYINYMYQRESDSEEEDGGVVGRGDRRPFVHMKTHPVMKKSQSADNLDEQAKSHASPPRRLTEQLLPSVHLKPGQEGFRPKNRAPPPPPPSLRQARERDKKEKLPSAREKLLLGIATPGSKSRRPLFHPPPPPTQPPPPPTQPPPPSHPLSPPSRPPPSPPPYSDRLAPEQRDPKISHGKNFRSPEALKKNLKSPEAAVKRMPEATKKHVRTPDALKKKLKLPEELKTNGKSSELKSRQMEEGGREGGIGKGLPIMVHRQHSKDKFFIREGFPNLKPKRHAPPPPPMSRTIPSSSPEDPMMGREESLTEPEDDKEDDNTQEVSTSNQAFHADEVEGVLDSMDIFTIELNRDSDRSLGMVIVTGKAQSVHGKVLEGVFVQKILPGSPADRDGRIQPGDMLVEIANNPMVAGTLPYATQILSECTDSVRLKIGRPVTGSAVIESYKQEEGSTSNLAEKLKDAELRISELEGEKERAKNDLAIFREAAEQEQKSFHKQLEDLRTEFERYKEESKQNNDDLTQALAKISVEKTKADKELEVLREARDKGSSEQSSLILSLRQQLSDAREAKESTERQLLELKTKDEELASLNDRVSELNSELAESKEQRETSQQEMQLLRKELDEAKDRVASLESRNQKLSDEIEHIRADNVQRSNVTEEFSKKSEALSAATEEVQHYRAENNVLSAKVETLMAEIERERAKAAELEDSLSSAKKSEKENTTGLQTKLQTQAKQIADLKAEVAAHKTTEKQQQQQQQQQQQEDKPDTEERPPPILVPRTEEHKPEKQESQDKPVKPLAENEGEMSRASERPLEPARKTSQGDVPKDMQHGAPEERVLGTGGGEKDERREERVESEAAVIVDTRDKQPGTSQAVDEISTITADFDDAVKHVKRLDSSTALHKSKVGSQLRRKKPSRDHLRSMGSLTNILESVPSIEEEGRQETESPTADKAPKLTVEKSSPTHPARQSPSVPPRPKPMPRARQKQLPPKPEAPVSPLDGVAKPQVIPRHQREHSDTSLIHEDDLRHRTSSTSRGERRPSEEDGKTVTSHKPSTSSPKVEKRGFHMPSPKQLPKLPHPSPKKQPLLPSPKHSPPPLRPMSKSSDELSVELLSNKLSESTTVSSTEPLPPPKPTPRHQRQFSREERVGENPSHDSKVEEIAEKDPSELTVKEKALLAQQAMDKTKAPPPVPRKPSFDAEYHAGLNDIHNSPLRQRAKSFDTSLEESPRHQAKKLPPGAFNLALPFGGSHGQIRGRSITAPEDPENREQGLETSDEHREAAIHYFKAGDGSRDEVDAPQRKPNAGIPPKRPPPPFLKRPSDERVTPKHSRQQEDAETDHHGTQDAETDHHGTQDAETDHHGTQDAETTTNGLRPELTHSEDANPLLQAGVHGSSPDPESLDYNEVLMWRTDHIAAWLMKIGLGQYQQLFTDKGIQGFTLFDLDGAKLKAMGVASNDDRGILKREIKVLKPYADKQKKLLEKQRKDEKKQAKKKKK